MSFYCNIGFLLRWWFISCICSSLNSTSLKKVLILTTFTRYSPSRVRTTLLLFLFNASLEYFKAIHEKPLYINWTLISAVHCIFEIMWYYCLKCYTKVLQLSAASAKKIKILRIIMLRKKKTKKTCEVKVWKTIELVWLDYLSSR